MSATARLARGLRNNNPGNLRDLGIPWRGLVGRDADGYCRFALPHDGIRALALDLLTKQRRHGLHTVRGIIERYAPPGDHNPTEAYATAVAAAVGVGVDDPLDLTAPGPLILFVKAVIRQENGSVPYELSAIAAAVQDALRS